MVYKYFCWIFTLVSYWDYKIFWKNIILIVYDFIFSTYLPVKVMKDANYSFGIMIMRNAGCNYCV